MSREVPFLDMRRSSGDPINCWIVYLMPFDAEERGNYDKVDAFQRLCVDNNIFGMGWDLPKDTMLPFETTIQKGAEIYREIHQTRYGDDSGMKNALLNYQKIQKGDYVVMRLKNGHYYVGKTAESPVYLQQEQEPFSYLSWGCRVERWEEYVSEEDIPSELRGRLSQRRHTTIQRIAGYRLRLLIMKLYEDRTAAPQFQIPPLRITRDNFIRCLDYLQLEDLVALHIWKQHGSSGYMLLPSSGKVSQAKYEFRFINVEHPERKAITCQVKNQADIQIEQYKGETGYEWIYLFSGLWSDEEAANKQVKCDSNVVVISPSELFETLRYHPAFDSRFYQVENKAVISIGEIAAGLQELSYTDAGKKLRVRGSRQYAWAGPDFLCFVVSDGLFYSEEFGALICAWGNYTEEEIGTLRNDLSRCLSNTAICQPS